MKTTIIDRMIKMLTEIKVSDKDYLNKINFIIESLEIEKLCNSRRILAIKQTRNTKKGK